MEEEMKPQLKEALRQEVFIVVNEDLARLYDKASAYEKVGSSMVMIPIFGLMTSIRLISKSMTLKRDFWRRVISKYPQCKNLALTIHCKNGEVIVKNSDDV